MGDRRYPRQDQGRGRGSNRQGRDNDYEGQHRSRHDGGRYDGGSYGPQNTGGTYDRGNQNYYRGGGNFRGGDQGRGHRGGFQGQGGSTDQAGIFKDPFPPSNAEEATAQDLDGKTRQVENALIVPTSRASSTLMPRRPGYGQQGTPITVYANHFRITPGPEANQDQLFLYRYSVSAARVVENQDAGPAQKGKGSARSNQPDKAQDPPKVSKYDLKDLFISLMSDPLISEMYRATDFASYIVTNKPITFNAGGWTGELDLSAIPSRQRIVRYSVIPTGRFSWAAMLACLQPSDPTPEGVHREEFLQLLNIIFGYNAIAGRPNVTQVGSRNVFFEVQNPAIMGKSLGGGLEAFKGFFASVRPATNSLLLNLNILNTAFYKAGPLEGVLASIFSPPFSAANLRKMERMFKHIRVCTEYQRLRDAEGNFIGPPLWKIKTIKGFSIKPSDPHGGLFETASQKTFRRTDGGPLISVKQYFHDTYGKVVGIKWPLCNLGTPVREEWVPVELCTVIPGQAYRRLLEPEQTSQMIKYAARPPNANLENIVSQGLDVFGLREASTQQETIVPWGMTVDRHPMRVPSRVLVSPSLSYSRKSIAVSDGDWNLKDVRFQKPAVIKHVVMINVTANEFSTSMESDSTCVNAFCRALQRTGLQIGHFEPHHLCARLPVSDPVTGNRIYDKLKDLMQRLMGRGADYLLFVLPNQDKWFYSRIKYLGDIILGVSTTCMVASKVWKKGPGNVDVGFAANVALKLNTKGGGVNHTIREDPTSILKDHTKETIYMGIDVTHPSPGSSDKSPSIAAVVASVDSNLSNWPASLDIQEGRQEEVQKLKRMVIERLDLWRRKNGILPREIIIYRDGVSEGQYTTLVQSEISLVKQAIAAVYQQGPPRLAFVVVGKRHHTRFYPMRDTNSERTYRTFNCKPGTVVDRSITAPGLHEFYLIAHKGLQGTAKPAHYVVALDEIGFTADDLQKLTYELCHTFIRATKSISVCPPVYYADLACERARCYLYGTMVDPDKNLDTGETWTGAVHNNLKDKTFYI